MAHRKLKKFAQVAGFSNVFQPEANVLIGAGFRLKGLWNKEFFGNANPITLELGCGRGEYTVGLARRYPQRNFIGMDIKGARLWSGAKIALEDKLANVAFIRNRIDFIENYFAENEISELWLPFPDPYPRKEQKRLMSPSFINRYKTFTIPKARIHLKTDNTSLHKYAMNQVYANGYNLLVFTDDIYGGSGNIDPEMYGLLTTIQTFYEKVFLKEGKKICYVSFCLP